MPEFVDISWPLPKGNGEGKAEVVGVYGDGSPAEILLTWSGGPIVGIHASLLEGPHAVDPRVMRWGHSDQIWIGDWRLAAIGRTTDGFIICVNYDWKPDLQTCRVRLTKEHQSG